MNYEELRDLALEQIACGNPQYAQAYALLALAEAIERKG